MQWRHSWECDLLVYNFYLFALVRHSHHNVEPALPRLAPRDAGSISLICYW
jgi:hypothetical protein